MFQETMLRDLVMAGMLERVDIVHCHTWYTHLAGCLAKQLTGASLVLTTHSLEPHRPWKVEQLGSAYQASSWIERTAYENADGVIAVSGGDAGGRSLSLWSALRPGADHPQRDRPERVQADPQSGRPGQVRDRPATSRSYSSSAASPARRALFIWSTPMKYIRPGVQVVLCAGAPDTKEIGREMEERVEQARRDAAVPINWIPQMLPKEEIIPLYTHASVFVCPSVYEPFGIINLEAMACETPVVASAVGGIKEVVIPGETGLLVPFEAASPIELRAERPGAIRSATWRPASTSFSTIRSAAGRWASSRATGSNGTSAGRALRGARLISIPTCDPCPQHDRHRGMESLVGGPGPRSAP